MKAWKVITTVIVALAAIAGIVYIVATYGDRIAAWARKLLNRAPFCGCRDFDGDAIVADQIDFEG